MTITRFVLSAGKTMSSGASGDGTVTNAIDGTTFKVLKGTTGVSVFFMPKRYYRFADVGETGVRTLDSPLTEDCAVTPPTLEGMPGAVDNPWIVGSDARAYVNDKGALVIEGTGATDDFASAADVPWAAAAAEMTAVQVANGVILGKNVLAVFADSVPVSATVTIGSMRNALGVTAQPSGAISGAKFERIDIVDGKAYLGVRVYTSDSITNQNWSVATNGVIVVPAQGKQGFFYLMSKSVMPIVGQ